jgi:Tol biopolymer transport system component
VALRVVAGAVLLAALLTGCGGSRARHDGAILFTLGARQAAVDPDGRHTRLVGAVGLVSPDGRERLLPDGRLVGRDRSVRLFRRGTATGFAWAPDGRTLAYVDLRGDYTSLWLVEVATGRRTRLTRPPRFANDAAPRWSPGGDRLLFERAGDVWVVGADGRDAHVLLRGGRDAQWSPDGRRIAYVEDAYYLVDDRLVVADADGTHLRAVSEPGAFTQFAWRPDGGALAFVSYQVDRFRLYVAAAPDFEPRALLRDPESPPAWSPSGRRLAVAAGTPAAIWVVDADGGGATRVSAGGPDRDPLWEPRGLPATALGGVPAPRRYTPPPDGR